MKQNLITDIVQGMLPYLNNAQSKTITRSITACAYEL